MKPTIHGLTDSKSERYVYALITRTNDLWETVKPINVAVKIKTELFAPKANPITKVRAKVSFVLQQVCISTSPGRAERVFSLFCTQSWAQDLRINNRVARWF